MVGGDGSLGDAEEFCHLFDGQVVEVAQHEDGALHAWQGGQYPGDVEVGVVVAHPAVGRGFRGHLGAPTAASPPRDERAVHGGAHVALEVVVVVELIEALIRLGERGLDEILCVLMVAGEEEGGPEQVATAGLDVCVEARRLRLALGHHCLHTCVDALGVTFPCTLCPELGKRVEDGEAIHRLVPTVCTSHTGVIKGLVPFVGVLCRDALYFLNTALFKLNAQK